MPHTPCKAPASGTGFYVPGEGCERDQVLLRAWSKGGSVISTLALTTASDASWTVTVLHPTGASESVAQGANGTQQVGSAIVGGVAHASLWNGTAASWVDLSAFLPPGFGDNVALGISSDGANIYITGYGFNTVTSRNEALLWTQPIPEPGSVVLLGLGGLMAVGVRRRRR